MTTVLESIRDWLCVEGVQFREVHHEPTRTSEDSARVRGEPLKNGGKALVMKLGDRFAVFVLPADRRAHSATIRRTLGVRKLRFATAEELLEEFDMHQRHPPAFQYPLHLPQRSYTPHLDQGEGTGVLVEQ